jgi:hypothetical protein
MAESNAQGNPTLLRCDFAVYECGMEGKGRAARDLRVMLLSAMSATLAPLVLTGLLVIRKVKPRLRFLFRHWNGRLQREIARWS